MVKKLIAGFIIVALIAAGIWYWGYYRSDEAVIRRKVEGFRETLEKDENSGNIAGMVRNQALINYIAPEIAITGTYKGIDGVYDRNEFSSQVFRGVSFCRVIDIDFAHIDIELSSPELSTVMLEATGYVETKSGKSGTESRDVTIELVKLDDDWCISRITAEPILQ